MGRVRRATTYVAVWVGATTLAVLLVWFGARPVLHNAVFGQPAARPVVGRLPTPAARPPVDPRPPVATRSATMTPSATPTPTSTPSADSHTYVVAGGRVVLSMTATSARLVSATPNRGYEVRTWHNYGWLRVDFTMGRRTSSLFATWNGHEPSVQTEN